MPFRPAFDSLPLDLELVQVRFELAGHVSLYFAEAFQLGDSIAPICYLFVRIYPSQRSGSLFFECDVDFRLNLFGSFGSKVLEPTNPGINCVFYFGSRSMRTKDF